MLIYLLRKDLLVQMQRYIILRIPAPPDPSAFAYTVTTATATASVRDHENPVGVTAERRQGTDGQGQGQSQGQAQGRDHGDGEKREVDEGISSLRRNSEDSGVGCSSGEGGGDAQDRLSWSAAASAGASSSSGRWGEWSSRTGGGGGAEASGGAGVGAAGGDAGGDGGWGQVYGPMVGYDADAKGLFDAPTLEPFEGLCRCRRCRRFVGSRFALSVYGPLFCDGGGGGVFIAAPGLVSLVKLVGSSEAAAVKTRWAAVECRCCLR